MTDGDELVTAWWGSFWRTIPPDAEPLVRPIKARPTAETLSAVERISVALRSGSHTAQELAAMTGLSSSVIITALRRLRIDQCVTRSPEPPAFGRPRVRYTWVQA